MKALPGIMHLHKKFKNPMSLWIVFTVTFLLSLSRNTLINSMALFTFSWGMQTTWLFVSSNNPRKIIIWELQCIFSRTLEIWFFYKHLRICLSANYTTSLREQQTESHLSHLLSPFWWNVVQYVPLHPKILKHFATYQCTEWKTFVNKIVPL